MLTNFSQQTNNWFALQSCRFLIISEITRLRSQPRDRKFYQMFLVLKSALEHYDTLSNTRESHFRNVGHEQSIIELKELLNY